MNHWFSGVDRGFYYYLIRPRQIGKISTLDDGAEKKNNEGSPPRRPSSKSNPIRNTTGTRSPETTTTTTTTTNRGGEPFRRFDSIGWWRMKKNKQKKQTNETRPPSHDGFVLFFSFLFFSFLFFSFLFFSSLPWRQPPTITITRSGETTMAAREVPSGNWYVTKFVLLTRVFLFAYLQKKKKKILLLHCRFWAIPFRANFF